VTRRHRRAQAAERRLGGSAGDDLAGGSPSTGADASTEGFFGELEAAAPSGSSPPIPLRVLSSLYAAAREPAAPAFANGPHNGAAGSPHRSAFAAAAGHAQRDSDGGDAGVEGDEARGRGAAGERPESPSWGEGAALGAGSRPGSAAIAIGGRRGGAAAGEGLANGALEAGMSLGSSGRAASLVNNESLGFDQRAVFDNLAAHARCAAFVPACQPGMLVTCVQ